MIRMRLSVSAAALLCSFTLASAQEKLPASAKIVKLEANPAALDLKNPFDYRQMTFEAVLDSGDAIDVTRLVHSQTPSNLLKMSPSGLARPVADGKGEIKIDLGGQTIAVPVTVSG